MAVSFMTKKIQAQIKSGSPVPPKYSDLVGRQRELKKTLDAKNAKILKDQKYSAKTEYVKTDSAPVTTIYIGNLSYKKNEEAVKALFMYFGYVRSVRLLKKNGTELNSGVAFVQMTNKEKALEAIKALNGRKIDDRTINVRLANDRFSDKK